MSDGKDFLAQSFAALGRLNRQHLDPRQPPIPVAAPQTPAWDTAQWTRYLASPAGKAVVEKLRSPDLAWKPLLVVDGQGSQQVAAAFKAISGTAPSPAAKSQPTEAKKAVVPHRRTRRPVPLPEVGHVETEQVQYVYMVGATRTRRHPAASPPAQPVPLFVQLNPSQGGAAPPWPAVVFP